jgi:hypothetical protein
MLDRLDLRDRELGGLRGQYLVDVGLELLLGRPVTGEAVAYI